METFTQPKITGYRQLTIEDAELMNEVKALANKVGTLIEKLSSTENTDKRWISIAQDDLQKGFMSLTRSIAQPTSF